MKNQKYWAIGLYFFASILIVVISQFDGSKDYYGRDPASLRESPGVAPAKVDDKQAGEVFGTSLPCSERKNAKQNKNSVRGPASTSIEASSGPADCPE